MNDIYSRKHRSIAMRRLAGFLSFALIGVGVAPQASFAQSNVEAARNSGLLGTWRLDCSQPASHDNPDLKYVLRDGELFHDRDFRGTTDSHRVIAARRRPDNSLELTVSFKEFHETRQYGFVHGRSDTPRTIYNRNIDTDELAA
jgi:hypothetical protein